MSTTSTITHVYVTYINATPDRVWQALTSGDAARRYWNGVVVTDWKPGSRWHFERNHGPSHMGGVIHEAVPPRRLVMSWQSLAGDDAGHISEVVFEIAPERALARLTVTHHGLDPDMAQRVNGGWPRVLASLKSLLETGEALDVWSDTSCSAATAVPVTTHAGR